MHVRTYIYIYMYLWIYMHVHCICTCMCNGKFDLRTACEPKGTCIELTYTIIIMGERIVQKLEVNISPLINHCLNIIVYTVLKYFGGLCRFTLH